MNNNTTLSFKQTIERILETHRRTLAELPQDDSYEAQAARNELRNIEINVRETPGGIRVRGHRYEEFVQLIEAIVNVELPEHGINPDWAEHARCVRFFALLETEYATLSREEQTHFKYKAEVSEEGIMFGGEANLFMIGTGVQFK